MNESTQLSMFDLLKSLEPEPVAPVAPVAPVVSVDIPDDELTHALRMGSGYEGGKVRIALFYADDPSRADAISFLKGEYGCGGHSFTHPDGVNGFIDYDGSCYRISRNGFRDKNEYSWARVEARLRVMIKAEQYLDRRETKRFWALRDEITRMADYHVRPAASLDAIMEQLIRRRRYAMTDKEYSAIYSRASRWAMKHDWAISEYWLKMFVRGHRNARYIGAVKAMQYYEDILEDCNFHVECELLSGGKYYEALQAYNK